jgi:hypothetical protein
MASFLIKKLNTATAYLNLTAKSSKVLTKKDFRNIITKNAIIGDMSMPKLKLNGNIFLMGESMGSVDFSKNCTIGLKGSGLTQLITARINISQ